MKKALKALEKLYDLLSKNIIAYMPEQEELLKYKEIIETALNKLGQYEDIEEELGIDLTALYKAFKHGYYYKNNDKIEFVEPNDEGLKEILYGYGKTWALTEEELFDATKIL